MKTKEYELLTQEEDWVLGAKKLFNMISMANNKMIIQLYDDSISAIQFNDRPECFMIISKPQIVTLQRTLKR